MVTIVPTGPDEGKVDVIAAGQFETTAPLSEKSSRRKVPPAPFDNDNVTVTIPLRPAIGVATFVCPIEAPDVGLVPFPTGMPFIAIDQFCGPELLRCLQKLKDVILASYPPAILNCNVIVVVPEPGFSIIACPLAPPALVHAFVLFFHEEPPRLLLIITGAAVYGCVVIPTVPKLCWYICAFA
jgi:hypothetical protein